MLGRFYLSGKAPTIDGLISVGLAGAGICQPSVVLGAIQAAAGEVRMAHVGDVPPSHVFTGSAVAQVMNLRTFQATTATGFIAFLVWWVLPLVGWTVNPQAAEALQFAGVGALDAATHPAWYFAFLVVRVIATIGLLLVFKWGRLVFAISLLAGLPFGLFSGVYVAPAIDSTIGYLSSLLDGAVLALAYFSPVSALFRNDQPQS